MNRIDRIAVTEHLALHSMLALHPFCERVRQVLCLPAFLFDCENMTEWGSVEVDGIEYNVSRPYEVGTLQKWDDTVPPECNFGISLIVCRDHELADSQDSIYSCLVKPVGERLANEFAVPVHYHRTWYGPGNNVARSERFHADAAS